MPPPLPPRRNSASGWDDMLENASVYSRIGPARSLVTRLLDCDKKSNPKLIEFVVTEVNVIARETKKGKH